jgi:hypothetical protein
MNNVRAVLAPVLTLAEAYFKAKAAGPLNYGDIALLFPIIPQLGPAVSDAKAALEEWKTASQAQRAEEIAFVIDNFDIPADNIEKKIEAGLALLIEAGALLA